MPKCVYCNELKDDSEMSKEHVIPQSLGGNLTPTNPFLLYDVCRRCNTLCGRYIDAPFIKSWLNQNAKANNALQYIDLSKRPIVPLNMGTLHEVQFSNKICELWLGPSGDLIYHFHTPYPDEPDNPQTIGRPLNIKAEQIDLGFVFLFVHATNPIWHPTIVFSAKSQFEEATLYLGNGPRLDNDLFDEIPAELYTLHNELKSLCGQEHSTNVSLAIDYGDRFLPKIALGLGTLFLDESFQESESANKLRKCMWTKRREDRGNLGIHGSSFFSEHVEPLKQILGLEWPSGHVIHMMSTGDKLVLYISIFESQAATIEISSDFKHWENIVDDDGMLFVISPSLQRYVGPIGFLDFFAHKNDPNGKHPGLVDLENIMNNNKKTLPPFHIQESDIM